MTNAINEGFPIKPLMGRRLDEYSVDTRADSLTLLTRDTQARRGTAGQSYEFEHEQDCCESVRIVRLAIDGDPGGVIVSARVFIASDEEPAWFPGFSGAGRESWTLTRVDIRSERGGLLSAIWLGESNGYYNEGISLRDDEGKPVDWEVTA